MTKEEAIENLKGMAIMPDMYLPKIKESINMAIEALEQESIGLTINVSDRNHLDSQIQTLLLTISNEYFEGDIEETLDYFNVMGDCL